ncbi:Hypothetical predicted protein [Podarcis lilfordi]|uniref:Reverse transcriptase domain-containing protein n=1 Tax=Podarcis lilfordi TaxID=74358 RepID=A0AA35LN49_9SAUR|nr:Hypothetical predicted protein [Podarcis lilfordi]
MTVRLNALLTRKGRPFRFGKEIQICGTKKKTYAKAEFQSKEHLVDKKKAQENQHLADTHDAQSFFKATKTVYGPINHGICPLCSTDGTTLLKDKEAIALRWKEHYQHLLNRNSPIAAEVLSQIPQKQIRDELAVSPNLGELCTAINQMKNNKAIGPDGIPAEVFKVGRIELAQQLHKLIQKTWEREEIPADFRNAKIFSLF